MDREQRASKLADLFNHAPIALTTGMRLSYNEAGQAVMDMPYNPKFDHALGGIHGGIIATMIDNAGWFTAAPYFEFWIATVEFSTRLLEPAAKSALQSVGNIVRMGKRLAVTQMEVKDEKGKLVAIGSGTFTLTSVPLKL